MSVTAGRGTTDKTAGEGMTGSMTMSSQHVREFCFYSAQLSYVVHCSALIFTY